MCSTEIAYASPQMPLPWNRHPVASQARLRACRDLSDKLHPPSRIRAAASNAWSLMTGSAAGPGRPTPRQVDALLVSGEAALLTSVTHLVSESAIGFLRCGLDIRSGWALYQQANAAVGGAATRLGEEAEAMGAIAGAVGVGAAGGVFRGDAGTGSPSAIAAAAAASDAEAGEATAAVTAADSFDCIAALGLTPESLAGMDRIAADISAATARLIAEGEGVEGADELGQCLARAMRAAMDAAAAPAGGPESGTAASRPSAASVEPALGGVLFGCGSFNVIGSVLPPTIAKLVQMLGFPANR